MMGRRFFNEFDNKDGSNRSTYLTIQMSEIIRKILKYASGAFKRTLNWYQLRKHQDYVYIIIHAKR